MLWTHVDQVVGATAICLGLLLLVRGLLSPTHMARTTKRKCPNPRSDAPTTDERIESSDHEEKDRVARDHLHGASATMQKWRT